MKNGKKCWKMKSIAGIILTCIFLTACGEETKELMTGKDDHKILDEVEKTQSPQLYIIETRRFTDTDNEVIKENRLRQIADNMKVSWNRFKMVTELTEGFEDRLSYGFDLIKYHGNWENLTEESWEYLFNAKEHPLKGWSVNSRHKIISYLDVKDITGEIPITE